MHWGGVSSDDHALFPLVIHSNYVLHDQLAAPAVNTSFHLSTGFGSAVCREVITLDAVSISPLLFGDITRWLRNVSSYLIKYPQ
jgi:hypothetical protein